MTERWKKLNNNEFDGLLQRVVLFEASVALALRKAMDNRKTVFLLSMGRLTLLAEV